MQQGQGDYRRKDLCQGAGKAGKSQTPWRKEEKQGSK
jgi:hypothetical protein